MNDQEVLAWIQTNLATYINLAIAAALVSNPALLYTTDWLAAITCRETGDLIARHAATAPDAMDMAVLMKGDYSTRPGEVAPTYHGYGFTQMDIASFPEWIESGAWKDPLQV